MHVAEQLEPLQANPLQDIVDGVLQLPAPLQTAARVTVPPEQVWVEQATVGYAHAALVPLQLPWQVLVPAQVRPPFGCPIGTVVQIPRLGVTLQAWQAPVQVPSQQYPSTQLPDVHCEPAVQAVPLATVPQCWLTHGLFTQSVSAEQVVAQAVPPATHL